MFDNLNHYISQPYSNNEAWFIDLQVVNCVSSEVNDLNNICNKNETEFAEKLRKGIYFVYPVQNFFFHIEDNDEDPIITNMIHFKERIDININKEVSLFLKTINFKEDRGIIFSIETNADHYDFDFREIDLYYDENINLNKKEDLYNEIFIYFNHIEITYKLKYQKIQECIGNIFAIYGVMITIYDVLIQIYNDYSFYCFNVKKYYKNIKLTFNTISEKNIP